MDYSMISYPEKENRFGAVRPFHIIDNEYTTSIDADNKFNAGITYHNINCGIIFEPYFDKIRDKIIALVAERNIDMSNIWHSMVLISYDPAVGYLITNQI